MLWTLVYFLDRFSTHNVVHAVAVWWTGRTCLTRFWKLTLLAASLMRLSTAVVSWSNSPRSDLVLSLSSLPADDSFSTLDRTSSSTFMFTAFSSALFACTDVSTSASTSIAERRTSAHNNNNNKNKRYLYSAIRS